MVVSNVHTALYRRRLFWRLRQRPRRPAGGEAAMIDKHTALEAISASLRDVTKLARLHRRRRGRREPFTVLRTSAARSREA